MKKETTVQPSSVSPAIAKQVLAVRAKKPTKDQIINQLIGISHELDWAYFWKDAERHKKAIVGLEEVKTIVGWHDR